MKLALKILSIISIVIGGLAIVSCVSEFEGAAFIGGALFLSEGILALVYIKRSTQVSI